MRASTASRPIQRVSPKAKTPRQAPTTQGPDLLGDLGRAIGKIFPAGRSGQVKNAMTTYGAVGKIMKGK